MNTSSANSDRVFTILDMGTMCFLGASKIVNSNNTMVTLMLELNRQENNAVASMAFFDQVIHPLYTDDFHHKSGWYNFPGSEFQGIMIWIILEGDLRSPRGFTKSQAKKLEIAYREFMKGYEAIWCHHCRRFVYRKQQLADDTSLSYRTDHWWMLDCGHRAFQFEYINYVSNEMITVY